MNSFFADKQIHWSGLKTQDFPCDIAGLIAVMLMKRVILSWDGLFP